MVDVLRLDDAGHEQWQILPCLARLRHSFLAFLPCIGDGFFFCRFRHLRLWAFYLHTGGVKQIWLIVRRQTLLAFPSEHLLLKPRYLGGHLLDLGGQLGYLKTLLLVDFCQRFQKSS